MLPSVWAPALVPGGVVDAGGASCQGGWRAGQGEGPDVDLTRCAGGCWEKLAWVDP